MDARIAELTATSRDLFSLTAQLSISPGPATVHAELIAAIRESLQQLDRDLSYAESFVEDVDDIDVREAQRLTIARLRSDHATHKRLYRRAVFKAKDNLQEACKQQVLEMTVDGGSLGTKENALEAVRHRRDANASSAVLQASSDVTAELRKTHALMSEELSRTALSQELLDESSATLARLGEEYTTFGIILTGSKRLLKELENADRIDQLWIWGSFGFFCLVVAFILYKRILSRPVNALIWTGSFMFSRATQRKIIEKNAGQALSSTAASSLAYTPEPNAPSTDSSPQDEIIDMVIPDLVQDEDESSRIDRARVNSWSRQPKGEEIVHVEL